MMYLCIRTCIFDTLIENRLPYLVNLMQCRLMMGKMINLMQFPTCAFYTHFKKYESIEQHQQQQQKCAFMFYFQ